MKRLLFALPVVALALAAVAADWPQWLGPARNGTSPETGLLTDWPATGPKLLWKVPGGDGYSSVAVVGDRAYTLVQRDGGEWAIALDTATGNEKWARKIAPAYKNSYGNGPRSTPAIDGRFVYVQSVTGPLVCLSAAHGSVVWQHNLLSDFGTKNTTWGLSASPLVEGNLVLAIPGGKGAGVAAFDKKTGDLAWKLGNDKAAYASPVAVTVGAAAAHLLHRGGTARRVTQGRGAVARAVEDGIRLQHLHAARHRRPPVRLVGRAGRLCDVPPLARRRPGGRLAEQGQEGRDDQLLGQQRRGGRLSLRSVRRVRQAHRSQLRRCQDRQAGVVAKGLRQGRHHVRRRAPVHHDEDGRPGARAGRPAEVRREVRVHLLGDNRTVPTIAAKRLYLRDRQSIYCLDIAAK